MAGIEPLISGSGDDHSASFATSTVQSVILFSSYLNFLKM